MQCEGVVVADRVLPDLQIVGIRGPYWRHAARTTDLAIGIAL